MNVVAGSNAGAARRLWLQLAHNRTVLTNAASMFSATVVTALLGGAFWLVAARKFSADSVGVASAAVSAMMLLGYVATVGLGTLLMGELPRREVGHRGLLNAALLTGGAIGLVLGVGFALVAPLISSGLDLLGQSWLAMGVFAIGVGLTASTVVLDQALIGLMRGGLQLWRNVVFAVVKLAAILFVGLLLAGSEGIWIYATWVFGIAASVLVLVRFYTHRGTDRLAPNFVELAGMRAEAATHHVYNLAIRAPDLILPLIVVSLLSAAENANFYIAWMIASLGFMVPVSLSSVLFAVGSGDPTGLHHRYRLSVGLSAVTALVFNLVVLAAGGLILSLFGAHYENGARGTLEILALGAFPETIKAHFLSIIRVERRMAWTMPLVLGGTAAEITGAVLGGIAGNLELVATGWLAAVCLEATVMAPTVFRFLQLSLRRRDKSGARSGSGES